MHYGVTSSINIVGEVSTKSYGREGKGNETQKNLGKYLAEKQRGRRQGQNGTGDVSIVMPNPGNGM